MRVRDLVRERLRGGLLTPRYRDDHFEMKGVLESGEGPICGVVVA